MLWMELILFFQPERNKNRVGTGNVKFEVFSWTEMSKAIITYLFETSLIIVEASRKRFLLHWEVKGQCDPFALLVITVQGIKSKKNFCYQVLYWVNMLDISKS